MVSSIIVFSAPIIAPFSSKIYVVLTDVPRASTNVVSSKTKSFFLKWSILLYAELAADKLINELILPSLYSSWEKPPIHFTYPSLL